MKESSTRILNIYSQYDYSWNLIADEILLFFVLHNIQVQTISWIDKASVLSDFPVKVAGQHVECAILLSSFLCQLMQIAGNETE